jgi:magnesium transporter
MSNIGERTAPSPALDGSLSRSFRNTHGDITHSFVDAVEIAVQTANPEHLRELVEDLHESDMGDLIEALSHDARPRFIELLGRNFDYTALTEVDDAIREDILDELSNEAIAEGVRDLDSDDAVYIVEDMDEADKAEVLENLPATERIALQRSLDYPEDSAGRRMQTEVIAVAPFWSVGQTIDFMRESEDLPETFYEVFVVDPAHRFLGTVFLDKLMRTKRPVKMSDIAAEDRHVVRADQDQEDVARLFKRYNLISAPVIDDGGRLVGVITIDDVVDVMEEEADEDLKALGGVKGDEELSDSVMAIVRSRFPWLFANLLTAMVAASVITMFETSIQKMVALAVLMPVIASMGGNAGTQTMTVTVRALATKELRRSNAWRIIRREVTVGLINGLTFAVLLGLVAMMWFGVRDLGVVVGLALVCVLTMAAIGGILIPLALDRMGIDPAVSSGPFVTTITDVVGFLSFLGIATIWFRLA